MQLQIHFGPNLAPAVHFVLGPTSEPRHDRQATTRTAFRGQRQDLGYGTHTSGIANAQREPVLDQLNLQVDTIALAASMTNCVRHKLARHEQSVLHMLLLDPAPTECTS